MKRRILAAEDDHQRTNIMDESITAVDTGGKEVTELNTIDLVCTIAQAQVVVDFITLIRVMGEVDTTMTAIVEGEEPITMTIIQ